MGVDVHCEEQEKVFIKEDEGKYFQVESQLPLVEKT